MDGQLIDVAYARTEQCQQHQQRAAELLPPLQNLGIEKCSAQREVAELSLHIFY